MERGTASTIRPFEKAELLDRLEGDEDLLQEIIDIFLAEGPAQMETLRAAIGQRDAPRTERAAHSLKGAAGNIGAGRLRGAAAGIESAARQGDIASVLSLLDALESEYGALRAELIDIAEPHGADDE